MARGRGIDIIEGVVENLPYADNQFYLMLIPN